MAEEAGRDPRSLSVTLGGAPEDLDLLKRNRDLGVSPHDRPPAAGQGRRDPAGPRPLGEIDPASPTLTRRAGVIIDCGF